jgi:hypothetical protein
LLLIIISVAKGNLLNLKARKGGGGGGSTNADNGGDVSSELPLQYGFEEETHYITDSTFKPINDTIAPYE